MPDDEIHIRPDPPAGSSHHSAPLPHFLGDDDDREYGVVREPAPPPKEVKAEPPPPVATYWEAVWPLQTRVTAFASMATLNVVMLPLSTLILDSFGAIFFSLAFMTLLQSFLMGTFDRIDLARSAKGKVAMTRTWRVAFYPLQPQRIRWSEFESVAFGKSYETHFEDWLLCILLLFYGLIPGILWYVFVIRPERVQVALCKQHGYPDTIVFRGNDEARAREISRTIADVTGMPYN